MRLMADGAQWVSIGSNALSAQIDPLGAQLSALRDRTGRDLLWDGNPAFWNGRAPLLFPIVGTLAGGEYRVAGKSYALPRHGFARVRTFEVLSASRAEALFRLRADDKTLAVYPFDFELQLRFAVRDSTLTVTATVKNGGRTPMPASFGYHPAFRWPLPFGSARELHAIEFDADEPAPVRRLDTAGLLTPTRHPTPVRARRLLLEDDLFREDVVILDQIRSHGLRYGADAGNRLQLRFPDTPFLGVWTKPGAPFICIEPWHGMSDPVGFSGDFTEKPGVFILPPGTRREFNLHVSVG